MKSTVDAKAFASAIRKISAALRSAPNFPQLEQVHAAFTEKGCRLTASDLNMWLSDEIPAEGDCFSLVFGNTKAIARASTHFAGKLTLELDAESQQLTISCGGKSGKFGTLDPELYPEVPSFEPKQRYPIRVDDLYDRVNAVSYAACQSESHPIAAGVRFEGDHVWCVDGQRLAIHQSGALSVTESFILKAEPLLLLREFNKCRGELAVGADYVSVKSKGLLLTVRRMKLADSLSIEKIVPQESTESYWVDRKAYLDALNYLRDCGGVGKAKVVFDGSLLHLDGKNGSYSVKVETGHGCSVAYAYSLSHMREALKQFNGRRQVRINVVDEKTPIVLTDNAGNTALLLTEPIGTPEKKAA